MTVSAVACPLVGQNSFIWASGERSVGQRLLQIVDQAVGVKRRPAAAAARNWSGVHQDAGTLPRPIKKRVRAHHGRPRRNSGLALVVTSAFPASPLASCFRPWFAQLCQKTWSSEEGRPASRYGRTTPAQTSFRHWRPTRPRHAKPSTASLGSPLASELACQAGPNFNLDIQAQGTGCAI